MKEKEMYIKTIEKIFIWNITLQYVQLKYRQSHGKKEIVESENVFRAKVLVGLYFTVCGVECMDIYNFLRVCGQSFIFACGCCRQMRGSLSVAGFSCLVLPGRPEIFYPNFLR